MDLSEREVRMEALSDTLIQRVDDLIESHHHERLLTTTSVRVVMHELVERNEGLEQAVRELALQVEELSARVEQVST
jgi:hypothetical protein